MIDKFTVPTFFNKKVSHATYKIMFRTTLSGWLSGKTVTVELLYKSNIKGYPNTFVPLYFSVTKYVYIFN